MKSVEPQQHYAFCDDVTIIAPTDKPYVVANGQVIELDPVAAKLLQYLPLSREKIDHLIASSGPGKDSCCMLKDLMEAGIIREISVSEALTGRRRRIISRTSIFDQSPRWRKRLGTYALFIRAFLKRFMLTLHHVFKSTPSDARRPRFLVILYGGIGDMICSIPMLRALRASNPHSQIDVLAKRKNSTLFDELHLADNVITYPGLKSMFSLLPLNFSETSPLYETRYDVIFSCIEHFGGCSRWFTGKIIAYLLRGRRIISTLDPESYRYRRLLRFMSVESGAFRGEYEAKRLLRHLEPLGINWKLMLKSTSIVPDDGSNRQCLLDDPSLRGKTLVGLAPFTSRFKMWSLDRFAAVAEHLQCQPDVAIIIFGTGRNMVESAFVCSLAKCQIINLTGRTTLPELVRCIGRLSLLISPDTGASHIASFHGIPQITLFGNTNPIIYGPVPNQKAIVLVGNGGKMKNITVPMVIDAATFLLNSKNSPAPAGKYLEQTHLSA